MLCTGNFDMTRAQTASPIHVVEWDVLAPVPALNFTDGRQTAPVRMLVRLGSEPLGYLDLEVDDATSFPDAAAASALNAFKPRIDAGMRRSGLPTPGWCIPINRGDQVSPETAAIAVG